METPFIKIFGLHISEPMTLVTDYIIAVMGVFYWKKLVDFKNFQTNLAKNLWAISFLFLGFAAFLGGTHHGFSIYLNPIIDKTVWKITAYSIGVVSFLFVLGTAKAIFDPETARFWGWVAGVKMVAYFAWMISHSDFLYLIIDYLPSMIAVLFFSVISIVKEKNISASWLASGVIVSLIGAGIQVKKFAPHEFFNHNDLYHVVQMGALYLFYRGVRNFSQNEVP